MYLKFGSNFCSRPLFQLKPSPACSDFEPLSPHHLLVSWGASLTKILLGRWRLEKKKKKNDVNGIALVLGSSLNLDTKSLLIGVYPQDEQSCMAD